MKNVFEIFLSKQLRSYLVKTMITQNVNEDGKFQMLSKVFFYSRYGHFFPPSCCFHLRMIGLLLAGPFWGMVADKWIVTNLLLSLHLLDYV